MPRAAAAASVHAINSSYCCEFCETGGNPCILCFMGTQGHKTHECTPWFKGLASEREANDFSPINPKVEGQQGC
jgi:hypothetical protein